MPPVFLYYDRSKCTPSKKINVVITMQSKREAIYYIKIMNVSGEIRLGIVLTALWAVILTFLTQNICPNWSFLSMNTCIMNLSISPSNLYMEKFMWYSTCSHNL